MTETDPVHQHLARTRPPYRWRRRLAVTGVAAVLVGSAVTGGALATGTSTLTPSSSTATTTQQPSTSSFGGPFAGNVAPSYGGRSSTGTNAGTAQTAGTATADQSTGLVEITSTLTNGIAAGTGLVLTADGTIVTNHHVVAGATSLKVTIVATGTTYTARYIGGDATTDVAVLQLEGAHDLTTANLAGTAAQIDDAITAVGDANGDGGSLTASPGTVSAVDRSITVQDETGGSTVLTGLIEVNAYVVPGDSGGAVLNSAGEVVGMNVAASTGSRNVTGYAIPIATVSSVVDQILAGSSSSEISLGYDGYLGVALDSSTTKPLVAGTENGGAAAGAGIGAGDTITSLNGTTVKSSTQLRRLLANLAPGDTATIGWTTAAGAHHTATVTLGRAPIA